MAKEVVITGATRGIGLFTAQHLAARGYSVSVIGRNSTRLQQAQNALKQVADQKSQIRIYQADLSLVSQTKCLASNLRRDLNSVDILINNAGALFTARKTTDEGFEQTLALNHFAYFTLTLELLPLLRKATAPRVVNVASDAHTRGRMHWGDLHLEKRYRFGGWSAYCQSKLANILFTREFSRRLGSERIARSCLHPGFVSSHFGQDEHSWMRTFMYVTQPFQRPVSKGAETVLWAATAPEASDLCGDYLKDSKIVLPSKRALTYEDGERLWEWSLQACGYNESPL